MAEQKTMEESITLIIAFNSMYDNFEIITAPLLHSGNKDLKEIE